MKRSEWLLLLIPLAITIILIPFLPEQLPMQFAADGSVNWTMSRYLFPLVGLLPFALYKLAQLKKGRK